MKKITTLFISLLLVYSLCFSSSAEAVFSTARELYESWAGVDNYPDYVCGVWSTNGSGDYLTIAVLDTEEGEQGKAEILDLVEDDSTVTFAYGEYSRDYLTNTLNEVTKLFKTSKEHGIVAVALSDKENRIALTVIDEYENNEVSNETLDNLKAQYGDVFIINYAKQPIFSEDLAYISSTDISIHEEKDTPDYSTIVLFVILIFSIAFMIVRKRHQALLKTTTGEVISSTELSHKEIENLIKNCETPYPETLDKKIYEAINEIK